MQGSIISTLKRTHQTFNENRLDLLRRWKRHYRKLIVRSVQNQSIRRNLSPRRKPFTGRSVFGWPLYHWKDTWCIFFSNINQWERLRREKIRNTRKPEMTVKHFFGVFHCLLEQPQKPYSLWYSASIRLISGSETIFQIRTPVSYKKLSARWRVNITSGWIFPATEFHSRFPHIFFQVTIHSRFFVLPGYRNSAFSKKKDEIKIRGNDKLTGKKRVTKNSNWWINKMKSSLPRSADGCKFLPHNFLCTFHLLPSTTHFFQTPKFPVT